MCMYYAGWFHDFFEGDWPVHRSCALSAGSISPVTFSTGSRNWDKTPAGMTQILQYADMTIGASTIPVRANAAK